jgi:hypothetical protein
VWHTKTQNSNNISSQLVQCTWFEISWGSDKTL